MPYWEHVSSLPKTTSHHWCAGILSLKRNQKPLALAKHNHWSEASLKLTCHQRKPHFLSSFLSFSSMKRSLMETGIFANGVQNFSLAFSRSYIQHKFPKHWIAQKTRCLKLENQETAENTIIIFQRNNVFKGKKIIRFIIMIHWKFTTQFYLPSRMVISCNL